MGIFFTSFGLLSFELLSTRLLGLNVGGYGIPVVLGSAMLGLGAAASVVGALKRRTTEELCESWLPALCVLNALAILGAFGAATALYAGIDRKIDILLTSSGAAAVTRHLLQTSLRHLLLMGSLLAIPNFLAAFVISILFRSTDSARHPTLYGLDLLGAALGSLVCVFMMEYGGYRWPLARTVSMPLLAGFCLARRRRGCWQTAAAVALSLS